MAKYFFRFVNFQVFFVDFKYFLGYFSFFKCWHPCQFTLRVRPLGL